MDPLAKPDPRAEAYKRELYRRSQDMCMVYNPTDTDYSLIWDVPPFAQKFVVPNKNKDMGWGKGKRQLQRYLAEKYCREMKDKLINELSDQKHNELKDKLEKAGVDDVIYKSNELMLRKTEFKTNNEELIKKYYQILFLGVVEEFGMDTVAPLEGEQPVDMRPIEEQVLATMDKKYVKPEEIGTSEAVIEEKRTEYPINKRKKALIEEVSQ